MADNAEVKTVFTSETAEVQKGAEVAKAAIKEVKDEAAVTSSGKDSLFGDAVEKQAAKSQGALSTLLNPLTSLRRQVGEVTRAFLGWSGIIALVTGSASALLGIVIRLASATEQTRQRIEAFRESVARLAEANKALGESLRTEVGGATVYDRMREQAESLRQSLRDATGDQQRLGKITAETAQAFLDDQERAHEATLNRISEREAAAIVEKAAAEAIAQENKNRAADEARVRQQAAEQSARNQREADDMTAAKDRLRTMEDDWANFVRMGKQAAKEVAESQRMEFEQQSARAFESMREDALRAFDLTKIWGTVETINSRLSLISMQLNGGRRRG